MDEEEIFVIEEDEAGQRLDKFLTSLFDDYSRMFLQRLIKDGSIKLFREGRDFTTLKAGEPLMVGDKVSVILPEEETFELKAEKIDLPILFEDEDILVINKPAGMVVHPGAGVHDGTLVNALLGYSEDTFRPMDEEGRPGIVHRLDKETSGVLIVAKTRKAKEKLSRSFASRTVEKFYIALLRGHIRIGRGTLETYIGRSKVHRQKMMVYLRNNIGFRGDRGFIPKGLAGHLKIPFLEYQPERAAALVKDFEKQTGLKDINRKKSYVNFLTSTFKFVNCFIKLDGFISFNLFKS